MAYLWISPLSLTHSKPDIGDGQCSYATAQAAVQVTSEGVPLPVTPWNIPGVIIDLSSLTAPATITVTVQPAGTIAATHWTVTCELEFAPGGTCNLTQDPDSACTVSALGAPPQSLSLLTVFLSRLRDVTVRIAQELQTLPIPVSHIFDEVARQTWSPLWRNPLPSRGSLHYVNTNRPLDAALTFSQADITPLGENLVFEVCGAGPSGQIVPKLFSVFWPGYVPRTVAAQQPGNTMWPIAEPTPFLIYYHPSTGQNQQAGYYLETYPESFDYLFYLHWANHDYAGGPLRAWWKGIPYQIAHSRTHAVLVVPCLNSQDGETGRYRNDGDFIVQSLEELQLAMLRKTGVFYCHPKVGRVALAGFSAGTQLVSNTLYGLATHPALDRVIKEVYVLDPNMSQTAVLADRVDAVQFFLGHGSSTDRADKMARVYTQIGNLPARTRLGQFLGTGGAAPMGQSTNVRIADSADGRRTAAVLPGNAWPILNDNGDIVGVGRDQQDVHQMVAGTMIGDALLRSGFAKQP